MPRLIASRSLDIRRLAALAALWLSAGLLIAPDASAATTVVKPGNMQGWISAGNGSTGFVTGPLTPPAGSGSLHLTVGAAQGSFTTPQGLLRTMSAPLDDLTALSFASFEPAGTPTTDPHLRLTMSNGDVLEYTASNSPTGSWQTHDALSQTWLLQPSTGNLTSTTMSAYREANPGATISQIAIFGGGVSSSEAGAQLYFDNLRIAFDEPTSTDTTYDFEPPALRISNRSVTEGDSGATSARFRVTLEAASTETVSVQYATADGTAKAPSDYRAKSGTLTFQPGQTSKRVSVAVNGDTRAESSERFFVNLSSPQNATLADAQGRGTIQNDE